MVRTHATPLTTYPKEPMKKGPGGMYLRFVKIFGAIASTYDVLLRMTNDPAKSVKAVLLPSVIAPKPVVRMPVKMVAWIGQLSLSSTLEKKVENGTALSRARADHVRPTYRIYNVSGIPKGSGGDGGP